MPSEEEPVSVSVYRIGHAGRNWILWRPHDV
jgi:hypothetical protein